MVIAQSTDVSARRLYSLSKEHIYLFISSERVYFTREGQPTFDNMFPSYKESKPWPLVKYNAHIVGYTAEPTVSRAFSSKIVQIQDEKSKGKELLLV